MSTHVYHQVVLGKVKDKYWFGVPYNRWGRLGYEDEFTAYVINEFRFYTRYEGNCSGRTKRPRKVMNVFISNSSEGAYVYAYECLSSDDNLPIQDGWNICIPYGPATEETALDTIAGSLICEVDRRFGYEK